MKNDKQRIIHFTALEQLNEEPETTGPCSLCGRVNTLVEMRSLPEVEEHARQVGSAIANNKPFPAYYERDCYGPRIDQSRFTAAALWDRNQMVIGPSLIATPHAQLPVV